MKKQDITIEFLWDRYEYRDGTLINKHSKGRMKAGVPAGTPNKAGYLRVTLFQKQEYIHRIIFFMFNGYWPKEIDHIDRDNTNNRIENLREATRSQNMANRSSSNTVRGVQFNGNSYTARIGNPFSRKTEYIGSYPTEEIAAKAYDIKAKEYFGDFAVLNFGEN
ncbi:MAG: hypothetical protein EOM67_16025 [Spirochaetia bacterium]|nr:hypothetical protein [Spirochaetia bacterium]